MSLTVERLENMHDQVFLDDFIGMPILVREKKYQVGLVPATHMRGLVQWGLENHSSFWIVREAGRPIVRLSARPCQNMPLHGTIGCFEMDESHPQAKDAFQLALSSALEWLTARGVKHVIAPVDFNTWFNYRFPLPGKKFFPRFTWEPTTPPEYLEIFKAAGFAQFAHYDSVVFPHFRIGEYCFGAGHLRRSYLSIAKHGFSLRPFDQENFMTKEVPVFHEISHEAFKEALLFEPIDLQTFSQLYAAAKQVYDASPSCVLVAPNGETAGFLFAFFDGDYLIIKSIAIRKKYQGLKLASGMIFHSAKMSFKQNKKGTISALVKTGISSEKIAQNSKKNTWFTWSHEYVLLKKDLP